MLQKATRSIPLALGIDTKNNPVFVDDAKWQLIENATFTKGPLGQIHTRNGYQTISNAINGGGNLSSGTALATLGNELDVMAGGNLYAYSPATGDLIQRATVTQCVPALTPIVRGSYQQSAPDSATLSGVTAYAWQDTRGGVWFKVVDQSSGTILQAEAQLSAIGSNPRVIAQSGAAQLNILWSDSSGNINQAPIPVATPALAPTPAIFIATVLNNTPFEIIQLASGYFGIAFLNTGTHLVAATLDLTTLATVNFVAVGSGVVTPQISCCQAGNGNFVVAGQVAGVGNQQMYVWFCDPVTCVSAANFNNAVEDGPIFVLVPSPTVSTTVISYVQVTATSTQTAYIAQFIWDQSGGYGGLGVLARGCGLISAPFVQGSTTYMLVAFISIVQPTYFLMALPAITGAGTVVGRYISLDAGSPPPVQRLTHATSPASNAWAMAIQVETALESSGGKPVVVVGLDGLTLNFAPTKPVSGRLGSDLTLSGGLPQLYDGEVVSEDGFNTFPESMTAVLTTSVIGITGIVDGSAATTMSAAVNQSFVVTFPINQDGSGNDGALLSNAYYGWGEYIIIDSNYAWWFNTGNNTVSAVLSGTGTVTQLYANTYESANTIATRFAGSVNSILSGVFAAVVSGNQVTITAATAGPYARPQTYSQFGICDISDRVGGLQLTAVNCISGLLIQPGYYFTLQATALNSGYTGPFFIWFQVSYDGGTTYQGTDPVGLLDVDGFPTIISTSVQILSTDSEADVAAKMATQLNAVKSGLEWSVNQLNSGPIVTMEDNANLSAPSDPTYLPTVGTMQSGIGIVGSVATNQWGAVSYSAIFEAQDAQGQLGRSATCVPIEIKFPDYGIGNTQVSIQVQSLYLTSRQIVDIAIYRTPDNGELLYRTTSPINLLINNSNNSFIAFYDATTDLDLRSSELCYSQPLVPNSVIPNNCPPAFTQLANFQDQLWINDCEDPQLWWFSKNFVTGVQVEFSVLQTQRFDPVAGPTVAAAAMDTNLIVFGARGIWALSGLGPDSTGAGLPFTVQLISAAVGCRDPGSVVLTPNGLMFMSYKGIYLLDRNLQVHYIGLPVEAYNANIIVSAQVVSNTTEVRFLCSSGNTLLYDYQYDQWSVFTDHLGVDSLIFGGSYLYLTASGEIRQESQGYYLDNTTGYSLIGKTAWIKFSGLQGFQRLWRAFLEGFFPGTNELQIQIAYDYDPTIVDTKILNPGAQVPTPGSTTKPGNVSGSTYTGNAGANVDPGTFVVTVAGLGTIATDDGAGNITGTLIAGTINYASGAWSFMISSTILNVTNSGTTGNFAGGGNPSTYVKSLSANVIPGSYQLVLASNHATKIAIDDGSGGMTQVSPYTISGGSITYSTGASSVTVTHDFTSVNLDILYQYYTFKTLNIAWDNLVGFGYPDRTQIRINNSRQKCEAMQLTIQMLGPFTQSSKALALNALDLEYGIKKGGFKIGPAQSI